ncbi:hypothetical protein DFH06DRAFT_1156751 [Mycena polygramma]|nr:hypothetical protein DFH06DRAFT_1156751 [Mycena polygramma]
MSWATNEVLSTLTTLMIIVSASAHLVHSCFAFLRSNCHLRLSLRRSDRVSPPKTRMQKQGNKERCFLWFFGRIKEQFYT